MLACAHAGCYSGGAPNTPQPPPPGLPPPMAQSDGAVASGGFAQPPPGASTSTPSIRGGGASTGLPTAGPECPRQDCPTTAPLYPTEDCSDGVHIGGRGPCVRFSNGTATGAGSCAPTASAQVTCRAADCDLPVPSEWLCPDGRSTASSRACQRSKARAVRPIDHAQLNARKTISSWTWV